MTIFTKDLKPLLAILLLIGMLTQTFSKFFIVANYQLNKEYIAKYLCENRDKPQMHCNGKCQMMKKLKQQEKKDQDTPQNKIANNFEYTSNQGHSIVIDPGYTIALLKYPNYEAGIRTSFLPSFFHPPQV